MAFDAENRFSENKDECLVSVCCLAYNHEKTIAQAIEGIVSQKTGFRFELIIHDDASTDKTAQIISEYAVRYPDIIKPIFQTENKFHTCNLAKEYLFKNLSKSSRYVAICEGDDYWCDENKLSMQFEIMEQNRDRTMCFHAVNELSQNGELISYRPLKKDAPVSARKIIERGGLFCPSVSLFIRRDIADLWPDFRICADVYDYPAQLLAAVSGEVFYIDKIMGVYRFASENSWTAQHSASPDREHINNETAWLCKFNEYTEKKYEYSVNFHLAHLWLCEFRKIFDTESKKECLLYVSKLKFTDKIKFHLLLAFFSVFKNNANKMWLLLKKFLLK